MSQHAMTIANQAGASFRADLNNMAAAIASLSSGTSAPTTTYAYMLWEDTTTALLKQRNGANSAWIIIGPAADLGIQSNVQMLGTLGGTADALTGAFLPAINAALPGAVMWLRSTVTNATTAPSLKPDGAPLKNIVKPGGSSLSIGDIVVGWNGYQYDAALDKYVLLSPASGSGAAGAFGQCRLSLAAGSLKLLPVNGNRLTVNGVSCSVPDSGVSLAATGLLATTLYYIYAVATSGVITSLEASISGHSTDTTSGNKGVEIKTGDSTRSLVGMAYVKTAATFADTPAQRFVLSWFSRKLIQGMNPLTSNASTTSASYVELSSSFRLEFLVWSGDLVDIDFGGQVLGNSGSSYVNASFGIDSTTLAEEAYGSSANQSGNSGYGPTPRLRKVGLTEGYHYATLLVSNGGAGNAITAYGGATPGSRCFMSGTYQG